MPWSCDMVVELPAPVGTADGAPASEEDDGAVPFDGAAAMGATATLETAWAWRILGRLGAWSVGRNRGQEPGLEKNAMPEIRHY